MIKNKESVFGWAGVALYVAVYDYWAIKRNRETLSTAFGRAMENTYARPLTVLIVAGLLKHLMFPKFMPKLDPLSYIAGKWRQGVEVLTPDE